MRARTAIRQQPAKSNSYDMVSALQVIETTDHDMPTRVGDVTFEIVGAMQARYSACVVEAFFFFALGAHAWLVTPHARARACAQFERQRKLRTTQLADGHALETLMQSAHEEHALNRQQYVPRFLPDTRS